MSTQHAIKKAEHETVTPFRPLTMMEEMERMIKLYSCWLAQAFSERIAQFIRNIASGRCN